MPSGPISDTSRADAIAAVQEVLTRLDARDGPIDAWERVFVAHALNSILRGLYVLALSDAQAVITPSSQRSPHADLSEAGRFAGWDADRFRSVLDEIALGTPPASPIFGALTELPRRAKLE